jgi:hypothetical protein
MRSRAVAFVPVIVVLLAESPLLVPPPFKLTDHIVLWYVGNLIATGQSPYAAAAWTEAATRYGSPHIQEILAYGASVWPYPPWTGYLFVPFGLLPVEIGPWFLHAAYLGVGLAAAIALAMSFRWRAAPALATALVIFAIFQPFVIAARWGQFASFLLAGLVLVFAGLRSRRPLPIILGALLLATKPQLTLLLGLVVLGVLLTQRATRTIVATGAVLSAVAAVTWLRYPEWLEVATSGSAVRLDLIAIFGGTWSLALDVSRDLWLPIGVALVTVVLAAGVLAVRWAPPSHRLVTALSAALVVALAVVPLVHSYDHLLLAPALLTATFAWDRSAGASRSIHAIALLSVAVVLPWILYLIGIFRPTQAASGLVPVLFALLLLSSAALLRRENADL